MAGTRRRRLLTITEVMRITSLGRSTILKKVKAKTFPQPVGIGRLKRWRLADIRWWEDRRYRGLPDEIWGE